MTNRTARAIARHDLEFDGVRLLISPNPNQLMHWQQPSLVTSAEPVEPPPEAWLHLREDIARAVYEALAEHYGHDVINARTLRNDYDAERRRVDKMIDAMIDGPKLLEVHTP